MLGAYVRKVKAVTVRMETVTLTGKLTCSFIKCMKLNAKLFSLSRHFIFVGVISDWDKYIFPWQTCFIWGVILVTVNLYSDKYGINKEH